MDATVVTVETDAWPQAFAAVEEAGLSAALAGRALRVSGASVPEVERALGDLPARVTEGPATLDERFFQITTAAAAGSRGRRR